MKVTYWIPPCITTFKIHYRYFFIYNILCLGQERFHTITTSYYRGAMGIMLVYDITNAKSFDNIAKWLRNIDEHANEVFYFLTFILKCL